MSSDSAQLRVAPVFEAEELPVQRPKTLRPVPSQSVATSTEEQRTARSNRRAALKLLQLREETTLTQVDAATLESLSPKTVGRYERGERDMPALRYFIALLEFREQQQKGGK